MDTILTLLAFALATVFAASGIAKLADLSGTRTAFLGFGLPSNMVPLLSMLIPILELVASIGLLIPSASRPSGILALTLLLGFTAAIVVNLAQGKSPACHCFGQLHSEPVGRSTLVRNLVFIIAALPIALLGFDKGIVEMVRDVLDPSSNNAVLIVIIVVQSIVILIGITLVVFVLAKYGTLRRQFDEGLDSMPHGLPVGSKAPEFEASNLDGETVSLTQLRGDKKPILLVFVSPTCGPCVELLPILDDWYTKEVAESTMLVLVSPGPLGDNIQVSQQLNSTVLVDPDQLIFGAYMSLGTPCSVVVDMDGLIAAQMACGFREVEALAVMTAESR